MNTILRGLFLFLFVNTIILSCNTKNENKEEAEKHTKKQINPNGDSELALLMREMYDEALLMKKQIKNGEKIKIKLDHDKILTAQATEPENANSLEYKTFAKSYLQTIENIKLASPAEIQDDYNSMVVNCITCHKSLCPGPLARINKLK